MLNLLGFQRHKRFIGITFSFNDEKKERFYGKVY